MYGLELNKAINKIKQENAKLVCIQLADGLKPKAKEIVDTLEKNTDAKIITWFSSCFGACDTPDIKGFDLLIQFGHGEWKNA